MAMKPIKLKDLLTQTKKPVTQQIEIMEDYVLSVKTVFEGAVKDVPEDMLSKYYISDWYVRDETAVLVVLVWVNQPERLIKYVENSNRDCHRVTMSQNGWTKEKVQAEIEKQKQFTAESIERNLLSYEPSWLEECYKAVDIKSFAAQFWGRYNFARENTAMRNEYDFSSAKRNPYTT